MAIRDKRARRYNILDSLRTMYYIATDPNIDYVIRFWLVQSPNSTKQKLLPPVNNRSNWVVLAYCLLRLLIAWWCTSQMAAAIDNKLQLIRDGSDSTLYITLYTLYWSVHDFILEYAAHMVLYKNWAMPNRFIYIYIYSYPVGLYWYCDNIWISHPYFLKISFPYN